LVCEAELSSLGVTVIAMTEDGGYGRKGRVTDSLSEVLDARSAVYCCGPTPMMRAVGDMCMALSVPCQLSLELPMPCGMGVCMGCVLDTSSGRRVRACCDGPVFPAETVVWK
jgi:dihydroorotate dehydrogenase electron transfer subunit